MADIVIMAAPSSVVVSLVGISMFLKKKSEYKTYKKSIYNYIKKAIAALDFDDIIVGFEKLKDFDTKNSDEFGNPKKKLFEKLFNRKRDHKCDKTEILFNIPKDMIDDLQKLKQHFQVKLKKDDLQNNLKKIEEEETKENESVEKLKVELNRIKMKQLAENNTNRKIIDDMNLTKVIEGLHAEYQELFIKTFEQEKDLTNIMQRAAKKQLILKRMNAMDLSNKKGNLRAC